MTATKLQNTTFLKRGKVELRNFEFRMSSVNTYYVMRTEKKKTSKERIACSIKKLFIIPSILIHQICIANLRAFHFVGILYIAIYV